MGVYQELPPQEYLVYVQDSIVDMIDVRTQAEYNKSHIHGARNVNFLAGHFKKEMKTLDLDRSQTILIYCETQHRSLFVAKKLHLMGFQTIIDLDKGMMHWRKLGFPVDTLFKAL
ncbi:MAG: hypothetical protein A3D92_21355 [Bacteroidetes bacterium RIFCSPHIGHO2_02_FULL_44_7]|nr:MAG: hypothetical protein A3D92_21355 [Bacteroidetes bacterium RIFCSPHIGHO2_02_FULL_44_7]